MCTMFSIGKKVIVLLILTLLFLFPRLPLYSQNRASTGRFGDDIILKIAVIGPGDELYFWWGHIGLVVEDKISGDARFYDWGVFSFENENFFVNFAFGRLLYSCMASRAESNYNSYINTNRDITLYTLDLPADKKEAILRLAETNMLPENRDYMYHHFRDNCATKIRDILDAALDGDLKAKFGDAPGRFTFREHVSRHTWFNPFFHWSLGFWMGQGIDRPITEWDDMFLPSEIALRISDYNYTWPDGRERPLVSSVEILNTSHKRPIVLDTPRSAWFGGLLISLLLSELVALFYLLYGRKNGFRIFFGAFQSFLGLFFGIAGSMLFFMAIFTDHDYTYNNSNLFFVNPLFLAIVPVGLVFALSWDERKISCATSLLKGFWVITLLGGLLTMVIKLLPDFYQQNQLTQALIMPLAIVIFIILKKIGKKYS